MEIGSKVAVVVSVIRIGNRHNSRKATPCIQYLDDWATNRCPIVKRDSIYIDKTPFQFRKRLQEGLPLISQRRMLGTFLNMIV